METGLLTDRDVIAALAAETGASKADVERELSGFTAELAGKLADGERVIVRGIGAFVPVPNISAGTMTVTFAAGSSSAGTGTAFSDALFAYITAETRKAAVSLSGLGTFSPAGGSIAFSPSRELAAMPLSRRFDKTPADVIEEDLDDIPEIKPLSKTARRENVELEEIVETGIASPQTQEKTDKQQVSVSMATENKETAAPPAAPAAPAHPAESTAPLLGRHASALSVYLVPISCVLALVIVVVFFIVFYNKVPVGPQMFRGVYTAKTSYMKTVPETNDMIITNDTNKPASNAVTIPTNASNTITTLTPPGENAQRKQRETIKKMSAFIDEIKNGTSDYSVKYRDSLWFLAKKFYGNGFYWPFIYAQNLERLKNPDMILPGQKLVIPKLPQDLLSDRNERIPANVRTGLAESYFEIHEIYISVGQLEHARWMLYLADRFDPSLVESKRDTVTKDNLDFITRLRKREGR
ncbi:MAG: LysM peptidoglycan-binding domain-containing protein [Spirochaetes bacterium]|nr:LysM peptidoglycan-binding domain-containing protein [Spirochaetota bacterium]